MQLEVDPWTTWTTCWTWLQAEVGHREAEVVGLVKEAGVSRGAPTKAQTRKGGTACNILLLVFFVLFICHKSECHA